MPEARWGARPFAEQLDYFRRKTNVPTRAWTDLWHEAHDTGFMVAGAYKADLLQDLRGAVDKAIADGTTLETFRRDFRQLVHRHGWSYNGGEGWRSRVIYEANLRASYAAGRYRQMTDPDLLLHRPWWMYRHSDAVEHPRLEHVGWDGLVLRADDPWWRTHYTPNGWGCQCWIETLSAEDLARLGKSGPDKAPEIVWETRTVGSRGPSPRTVDVPKGIDPGWAYAPGASRISDDARRALRERLPKLDGKLRTAVEGRLQVPFANPGLDEAIEAGRELLDELAPPRVALSIEQAAAVRLAIRERLAAARPVATPAATATRRGAGVDLLRAASTRFPDDWTQFADGFGPLHVRRVETRAMQYTHGPTQPPETVPLTAYGDVDASPGEGFIIARNVDSMVHEFTHRLQAAMPELDRYFQDLHKRRTVGEELLRLSQLTGFAYGPRERARRDKYVNPYFGKEYWDLGPGQPEGALEVMTMSYDRLLGDNDEKWFEFLRHDRQLVELAIGLLFRWRP
ncbi:MAG: phage minor head protein [Sneathiellaceae bacterium]